MLDQRVITFLFFLAYLCMLLEFVAATSNMLDFSVVNCIPWSCLIFAANVCVVATPHGAGRY